MIVFLATIAQIQRSFIKTKTQNNLFSIFVLNSSTLILIISTTSHNYHDVKMAPLIIHKKLIQKMWHIEKIICIFNNILQKISSQKSFLWKSENDHKKDYNPWIFCHHWFMWLWSHMYVNSCSTPLLSKASLWIVLPIINSLR